MIRLPAILLLLVPAVAHAHTTEMLGGRLDARPDGAVELRLEISAQRLPVFAAMLPGSFATWGDVRAQEGMLTSCFQRSLAVFVENRHVDPAEVMLPGLASAADAAPLPEFVLLVAVWRDLPVVPNAVIPRFDLTETYVMLIIDDQLGGPAESPAVVVTDADGRAPVATAPAAPAPAGTWWRMVGRALVVGYEHIVPHGLDHILFVLGLFFAVRRFRDLVWQVTMFTVAHSITLGLAMAGVVVLSDAWATAVEIGIAVSIAAVAAENCFVRQAPGWRRLAVVGAFGLIHGLGFAGALSEVNWPAEQFAVALLAANVGIELGQLTVVGAAAVLTAWAWRRTWYRRAVAVPASIAIGACGLYWAIERTAGAISG